VQNEGASCIFKKCPEEGCGEAVTITVVRAMAAADVADKWATFELKHFVTISKDMAWCPGKGCSNAFVARASVKFEVLRVAFCAADASRLLVVGATVAQAWTLSAAGEVADRTPLGAAAAPDGDAYAQAVACADGSGASSAGGVILAAEWLPGSRCRVMLATAAQLLVFDSSRSHDTAATPLAQLQPPADAGGIADACLAARCDDEAHPALAFALTDRGRLFAAALPGRYDAGDATARAFAREIQLPAALAGRGGLSLAFSAAARLLLASFDGGATRAADAEG
jgi:hypothetical protein